MKRVSKGLFCVKTATSTDVALASTA